MEADLQARRPALDGLRGIAVLLVLAAHAAPSVLHGGVFGIDIFFVLSGYLITSALVAEPGLARFWARRARRLLPALGVVLTATALLLVWLGDGGRVREWRVDMLSVLSYTTNWRMLTKGVPYDQLASGASPFVHLWSVAVEEQFYILWPLVLSVPVVRSRIRAAAVLLVLGGVGIAALLLIGDASLDRLWFGTDVRAAQLGIGAVLATLGRRRLPTIAGWAGMVLVVSAVAVGGGGGTFVGVLAMVLATAGTFLVLADVEARPHGLPARLLSQRPVVFVGVISYGVYLWHAPLLWALHRLVGAPVNVREEVVHLLALLVSSLLLASFSWRFLEAPLLGRTPRALTPRRAVVLSAGIFSLAGVFSLGLTQERGLYLDLKEDGRTWQCPEGSPVCAFLETGRPDAWECIQYLGCELYTPTSPARTVLIAGDSVLRSLTPALIDEARERNWRLVGLVRGCGPHDLQGGVSMLQAGSMTLVADGTTSICPDFPRELGEALDHWGADLVIVGNGRSREAYLIPGSEVFVGPGDERYLMVYTEAARRVHQQTSSRGIPLIVMLMVEPVVPPGCVDAAVEHACVRFNPIPIALPGALAEMDAQRRAYSALPDVTMFDPGELVCRSTPCPSIDTGRIWRYDGLHYALEPSRVIVRELLEEASDR